jgi:hypothetical protein
MNQLSNEELQKFYDTNRISLLQYESLRKNFNKMFKDVLGEDYYNMAMDVYDADRICCEDITRIANKTWFDKLLNILGW